MYIFMRFHILKCFCMHLDTFSVNNLTTDAPNFSQILLNWTRLNVGKCMYILPSRLHSYGWLAHSYSCGWNYMCVQRAAAAYLTQCNDRLIAAAASWDCTASNYLWLGNHWLCQHSQIAMATVSLSLHSFLDTPVIPATGIHRFLPREFAGYRKCMYECSLRPNAHGQEKIFWRHFPIGKKKCYTSEWRTISASILKEHIKTTQTCIQKGAHCYR